MGGFRAIKANESGDALSGLYSRGGKHLPSLALGHLRLIVRVVQVTAWLRPGRNS